MNSVKENLASLSNHIVTMSVMSGPEFSAAERQAAMLTFLGDASTLVTQLLATVLSNMEIRGASKKDMEEYKKLIMDDAVGLSKLMISTVDERIKDED